MASSCCGEADAYEADEFETDRAGNLYAILTESEDRPKCWDDREGDQVCKPFIKAGTRFLVPPDRILKPNEPPNKTGHGWVFLSTNATPMGVICYSFPSGL